MGKCKNYFKRALSTILATTMVLGSGTISNFVNAESEEVAKKDLVIYFANWSVYGDNANQVKNLPWDKVTYINHAFWEINPVDGEENKYTIDSTDSWADIENGELAHFPQYEEYSNLYPDVNVMISVGGWTRCGYFSEMASTAEGRKSFIDSCIDTMDTYTWVDGIDVDWEYPGVERDPESDTDEGCPVVGDDFTNYTLLLKEMREAFDEKYGEGNKKITTCSSVNLKTIAAQDVESFAQYVDLINIMCYDMTGSYDPVTGHQTALYSTNEDMHSVDKGVSKFLELGVPASKINIGSPLYCHGWGGVKADESGNVVGVEGSSEGYVGDMVWNQIKALELKVVADGELGWHKGYDEAAEAAYLYNDNPNSRFCQNYLTYEDEQSLAAKLAYIQEKNLAGIIVWEAAGDRAVDAHPMLTQMSIGLGIYKGEQSVYGQSGTIPEIEDTVSESGYPNPINELVEGTGTNKFPSGSVVYYKGSVYKSINDNADDYTDNLPDGKWGAGVWEKLFDVKEYVSQEKNGGAWAWAADEGEYIFYDPDEDGIGDIYYATKQISNTADDAPDGKWGADVWNYITGLQLDGASVGPNIPENVTEVVAGSGENKFPSGTVIYYKGAFYESVNDAADDWVDNLPDGKWGAGVWKKLFDVKEYVSQADKGYWDYSAEAGEYVFYDPDKDGVGAIYLATQQVSNTADDAPDGKWGDASWQFVTYLTVAAKSGEEETTGAEVETTIGAEVETTKAPETTTVAVETESATSDETTKAPETATVAPTTKAPETTTVAPTAKAPETTTVASTTKATEKVVLGKSKIKKASRAKNKKKVKLTFKKVAGAAGYEIMISTSKKFKEKSTRTVESKKLTKTIKKLKSGKKYYAKVRAFAFDSNRKKVYGKWSKRKTIK
ncbi:MAG: hypothetical protein K6G88_10115 [Lachnospiraceae bacterium]|nr:hypothetical protein [Lachnospiraceae bacterium]